MNLTLYVKRLIPRLFGWFASSSKSQATSRVAAPNTLSDILRTDLISSMPVEQVFQKHVVDGLSYFFNKVLKKPDLEYQLRYDLATSLDVSINDVVIVGSAKLGFSVKTLHFRAFDYEYNKTRNPRDKSDIDVAVVNRRFYEKSIEQIFHLSRHFDSDWVNKNWRMNLFNKEPRDLVTQYALYLARGWLRPDFLPNLFYEHASWRPVCDHWYRKTNKRKITVGFYSDWTYLKHYQMDNLEKLRYQLNNLDA